MADRGQLIIRLHVDGRIQAETKHIHGDTCVPFAAILEDLCDAEAIDSDYTQDYYATGQTYDEVARTEQRDNA
jgi:Protein of unknown function (DUF2997)